MAFDPQTHAFQPDAAGLAAFGETWGPKLPPGWEPIIFSVFGDLFFEGPDGVYWLNTGTSDVKVVARDSIMFGALLHTDEADEWFLPPLVEKLHKAGKAPSPGQCFCYLIFPVFEGGLYEPENFFVAPAHEYFLWSSSLHDQLEGVPEGGQVRLRVVD